MPGKLTFPSGVSEPKLSVAVWPPANLGKDPQEVGAQKGRGGGGVRMREEEAKRI